MKKIYIILIVIIAFHILILLKLRFTAWPETLSFPYLINQGFTVYKDMVHAYPPLLIEILSFLYKIFGYKIEVLKALEISTLVSNDVLIFLVLTKISRKPSSLTKYKLALSVLFLYVILQPILEGNTLWPDIFMIPFLLSGMLLILNKKYLISAIALSLAFLVKQTSLLYILSVAGFILIFEEEKKSKLISYITGLLIIALPFFLWLFLINSLPDFINWTIIYPSLYWTKFPGYVQLTPSPREYITILALFSPLILSISFLKRNLINDKTLSILSVFLICAVIGIYPRFSFFHFQPALAFLLVFVFYLTRKNNSLILLIFMAMTPIIIIANKNIIKSGEARFWTSEDINIGQILKNDTPEGQPIFILGLNSNLYALSRRLPNKPWLDNFGWYLEIPGVQEKVIASFVKNPPSAIFWRTPDPGNWYDIGAYQPKMIVDWIRKNYYMDKEVTKGVWEWKRR